MEHIFSTSNSPVKENILKIILIAALLAATPASALIYDFDSLTPTVYGGSYVTSGSIVGVQVAPNATNYLNTIGMGGISFGPIKTANISFDVGSPDNYNKFEVLGLNDEVLYSKTLTGNGNRNVVNTISYSVLSPVFVTGLRFYSGQPAMEVDNINIEAVPEPATWAMMIAGFGLVGMSLRNEKRKTVLQ